MFRLTSFWTKAKKLVTWQKNNNVPQLFILKGGRNKKKGVGVQADRKKWRQPTMAVKMNLEHNPVVFTEDNWVGLD